MSTTWRVIKFDPFSHEVTSKNLDTGGIISVVVPIEHRTVEKSAAFMEEFHAKHTRPTIAHVEIEKPNIYKCLFIFALAALCFDACLRAYGI